MMRESKTATVIAGRVVPGADVVWPGQVRAELSGWLRSAGGSSNSAEGENLPRAIVLWGCGPLCRRSPLRGARPDAAGTDRPRPGPVRPAVQAGCRVFQPLPP